MIKEILPLIFAIVVIAIIVRIINPKSKSFVWVSKNKGRSYENYKKENNKFAQLYKDEKWSEITLNYNEDNLQGHLDYAEKLQAVGLAWFKLKNYEEAEKFVLLASNKGYGEHVAIPLINIAILYRDEEMPEKSLEWVLKVDHSDLRSDKKWPQYYRTMRVGAEAFKALGRYEEGINFLKNAPITARIINEDLADVLELLSDFYERTGQFDKALKCLQKVVTARFDKDVNDKIRDLTSLIEEKQAEKAFLKNKKNS